MSAVPQGSRSPCLTRCKLAAASVGAALDRLAEHPKVYILDFAAVPLLDSTAAITIAAFAEKAHRGGTLVLVCGASRPVRHALLQHGVRRPLARFVRSLQDAVAAAHEEAHERAD